MNKTTDEYNFDRAVCELVKLVPAGRVTTYGAIAKALGVGRSSRMVGMILSKSHAYVDSVPAHRVVNRNGFLTGKHHFETPSKMEDLLKAEGVMVVENQVQNFQNILWNPIDELDL